MNTLSQASGVAALILAVEIFVIGLLLLFALFLAVRAMGQFLPKVRYWLQTGAAWLLQAEAVITMLMQGLLAPILFLSGLWAGLGAGARALRRR